MNKLGVIVVIVGIVFLVSLSQDGWDGFKSNPGQSTIDSSKTIFETGKKVVDTGKNIYDNSKSGDTTAPATESGSDPLSRIGQPFCSTDLDCDTLEECNESNPCICGEDGYCYQ